LPAPKIKNLTLRQIKLVLAKSTEGSNLIAITGKGYEQLSDNDKAKYEAAVVFGLIALHYQNCIIKHNEEIDNG